ncbi:MAG: hypothetical protein SFX73_37105 [Kofleriaceae bacterium]|nr:hypothetical protein [Kofleriaceae bacterium]
MRDLSAFIRAAVVGGAVTLVIAAGACGNEDQDPNVDAADDDDTDVSSFRDNGKRGHNGNQNPKHRDAGVDSPVDARLVDAYLADAYVSPVDAYVPPPDAPSGGGGTPTARFDVTLIPNGVTGTQRVNFAVPLAAGALADASKIRVLAGTAEVPAARRGLAQYSDGSWRSVQVQADVNVSTTTKLTVELGVAGATGPTMVAVETTVSGTGSNVRPKVWTVLPATTLAASTVFGPMVAESTFAGTARDAWSNVCDYTRWNTSAFLVNASTSRDVWLFDRVTAMYRGYALTGSQVPLESAYREAAMYRDGMMVSNGVATAIPVPTASSDLKYYYSQGMALHYLLTGDDRYREAAEAVSAKVVTMWGPTYDGSDKFWTERHAGFALLAHEWALMVTDDKAATIAARSEAAVSAFLAMQVAPYFGQTGTTARCFAHSASAHGESYGGAGCSPWMSAILADALDGYQRRVGGTRAAEVRTSLGRMAKMFANEGRDATGKPFYWMGVGTNPDEVDAYDEHWGEMAYVIALGWNINGKTDAAMKQVADALVAGMKANGEAGQVRSFNWQCRSAVMTPALLN